jgi:hypothetical protein
VTIPPLRPGARARAPVPQKPAFEDPCISRGGRRRHRSSALSLDGGVAVFRSPASERVPAARPPSVVAPARALDPACPRRLPRAPCRGPVLPPGDAPPVCSVASPIVDRAGAARYLSASGARRTGLLACARDRAPPRPATTMIYTHVLDRGPEGVRSPADRLLDP